MIHILGSAPSGGRVLGLVLLAILATATLRAGELPLDCSGALNLEVTPEEPATTDLIEVHLCGEWPRGSGPRPADAVVTISGSEVLLEIPADSEGPATAVRYQFTVPLRTVAGFGRLEAGDYLLTARISDVDRPSRVETASTELTVSAGSAGALDLLSCLRDLLPLPFAPDFSSEILVESARSSTEPIDLAVQVGWCRSVDPRLKRLEVEHGIVRLVLEVETGQGAAVVPFDFALSVPPLDAGRYYVALLLAEKNGDATALVDVVPIDVSQRSVGACASSRATLCLDSGSLANRFAVEADWEEPDSGGLRREAVAQRLSRRTGAFTFFDRDNLEVVVKVLEACQPFGHFWVFVSGLTDLPVGLRIVDTATGKAREYSSPGLDSFDEIRDLYAFPCP